MGGPVSVLMPIIHSPSIIPFILGITGASSDGLVKVCFYERTGATCLTYSIVSSGLTHLSE